MLVHFFQGLQDQVEQLTCARDEAVQSLKRFSQQQRSDLDEMKAQLHQLNCEKMAFAEENVFLNSKLQVSQSRVTMVTSVTCYVLLLHLSKEDK